MNFFDLHCDTIGECRNKNLKLRSNNLHIDLLRGAEIENWKQVFAVWIPDTLRGEAAFRYFLDVYECYKTELFCNNGDIKNITPILSVEGGAVLGGDINRLYKLKECGVKLMTLTWNGKNEIASGAFEESGGLTPFGKDVIREMENIGITVDVSHLNRQSFFDVAGIAKRPFVATHSNADIVNKEEGRKRNLTDEQIKIIGEIGGLVGLNFYDSFLDDENAAGTDALLRQIEHFNALGYENIIAFGSDFDGCRICPELSGIEKIPEAKRTLIKKGLSEKLADNIFYDNAARFFNML